VYVSNMQRVGSTLEIRGTIENRTQENITLGLKDILFVDAVNTKYGVGESSIELVALKQQPFSFQVPVPPGRPLQMIITLDADPAVVVPLSQESMTP